MGAYTKLSYRIVFGTRYRKPLIDREWRGRLFDYLGGIIRTMNGHLLEIGRAEDHVHILTSLPATLCLADAVRDLKANSSKWINDTQLTPSRFEWQKGYSAFTVSYSQIEGVRQYLRGQEEHHKRHSFEEEYVEFLKRHDVLFEPKYLFEGEHFG